MTTAVANWLTGGTPADSADLFTPRGRASVVRVCADRGADPARLARSRDQDGGGATVLTADEFLTPDDHAPA